MPSKTPPDFHAWNVQNCHLVTHETTGLRFFIFDNYASQQTDVAIVSEFADHDIIEIEAKAAGYSADDYSNFLADRAMEAATRYQDRATPQH